MADPEEAVLLGASDDLRQWVIPASTDGRILFASGVLVLLADTCRVLLKRGTVHVWSWGREYAVRGLQITDQSLPTEEAVILPPGTALGTIAVLPSFAVLEIECVR